MTPRETKPCKQCGVPVEIVPAGISKRTHKPYPSFAKCKECGFSENFGEKPRMTASVKNEEVVTLLQEISQGIARLVEIAESGTEPTQDKPF